MLANVLGLASPEDIFPWQKRLLVSLREGTIPAALDIPTGLGKTAVMAVWLVARAGGAKLPRRLVYVVDRRAVVDQATDVALRLRSFVDDEPGVRSALGLRSNQSLPISTLRGQFVDNREWLTDPAGPAIIVGTVDMVGSRLLFEGYGVSRKMRPYHAGLLGTDTLIVLDEAHLVPPFEHLLRSVAAEPALHASDKRCRERVPPFRLLTLSATGRTYADDVAGLTEEDLEHDVVRRRLNAKKLVRIEALDTETKLEDALANRAWMLADEGKKAVRVLVYSDSREVARKAKDAVQKRAKGDRSAGKPAVPIEADLFVGGRRMFEREGAKERLKSLGFIAGSTVERSGSVFLFATSAGEVGVDLDADHMVCDLVAWERMVQRLGRVNRRGEPESNAATIVVIVEPKPQANRATLEALQKLQHEETLQNKERERAERLVKAFKESVRDWENRQKPIKQLRRSNDESFDASPGALQELKARAATDEILKGVLADATTPEPLRPALTRPLVDAWAMTSLKQHTGRPAIQPWLQGWIENDPPQTAVVWRTYLPVRAGGPSPGKKEVENFFEAAPPHGSEILETETFRVLKWLGARARSVRKEQAAQGDTADKHLPSEDEIVAFALDPDGGLRRAFRLAELDPHEDKRDRDELDRLLAGGTFVLDARLAGLRDGLLDDTEFGVPRTADDGHDWLSEGIPGFRVRSVEAAAGVLSQRNWRERFRLASAVALDGEASRWLVVEKWRHDASTEEDRSAGNLQLLDEHQTWAEKCAVDLAKTLGLDDPADGLGNVLRLAARLHDEGKRATVWQRAFRAPRDGVYAKTEGPINYDLLDGYRHELGSLLRVENDERIQTLSEEHRDLVLHLIAAHHGFARPVIGTSGCEDAPPSALKEKAAEIALRFARLQDRWGPWGLAWWEALLRAADQQASRENDGRVEQTTTAGAGMAT